MNKRREKTRSEEEFEEFVILMGQKIQQSSWVFNYIKVNSERSTQKHVNTEQREKTQFMWKFNALQFPRSFHFQFFFMPTHHRNMVYMPFCREAHTNDVLKSYHILIFSKQLKHDKLEHGDTYRARAREAKYPITRSPTKPIRSSRFNVKSIEVLVCRRSKQALTRHFAMNEWTGNEEIVESLFNDSISWLTSSTHLLTN